MLDPSSRSPEPPLLRSLDRLTRRGSEELARTLGRRAFLQRAGGGAFLLLATLASGQGWAGRPVRAQAPPAAGRPRRAPAPPPPGRLTLPCCTPPGPYCNLDGIDEPNGCQGANCFAHLYAGQLLTCTLDTQFYGAGCWTTSCQGGYYTCCACRCANSTGQTQTLRGCAQFSASPGPARD